MEDAAVVAFDPGRTPGVAWLAADGRVLRLRVLSATEDAARLGLPPGVPVVVGDGTGSRTLSAGLRQAGFEVHVVDESRSSEEARRLYWQHNRPGGLSRLLPPGLRPKPHDLDAYAAAVIGRRWLHLPDARKKGLP